LQWLDFVLPFKIDILNFLQCTKI